jgi:hypothetical protein
MTYSTPFDLAYRTISQPSPPKPAHEASEKADTAELTRTDVELILQHRRAATPDELQHIIDDGRKFHLTDWEQNALSVLLTVEMAAQRAKSQGRLDHNALFIHRVLGYAETPHGLLANREFFEREFKAGAVAISRCTRHKPPRCECWRDFRERLWNIADRYGGKSPEAWSAQAVWQSLEELELAARPERVTGMPTAS